MAESEARTDSLDDETLSTGFQIDICKEHGNWLTVGELIRSIQKPISIYVDEIVKAFHEKVCNDLLPVGKCSSPEDCKKKTRPSDLCKSCKCWFKKLEASHEKGNNPSWHKNCKSAEWSEDHWEVAKFFMPALGSNLSSTKDAESTDISSLLNVLEWMKDVAFLGKVRVSVDLVRKLRSQRNPWAHAPKQKFTDDEKAESCSIATDFLEDLEKVFPHAENAQCLAHLKHLKTNGVTNVVESERQSLLLQRHLLDDIKEEITTMKVERSSDKSAIEEHGQKLMRLECALSQCSQRMTDFESFKENINKRNLRSCLPDEVPNFTARDAEIKKIVTFLMEKGKAVVSLHGGPGFGKTAIATQVSNKLSKDHNIPVIFSKLTTASTVAEIILQLCSDVGVYHDDDPKSSLILWLKNVKSKVIFVMDDIDNLLGKKTEEESEDFASRSQESFYEFIRLLRKNSNQHCQIITTSRTSYDIPDLLTGKVEVVEMDDDACIELLRKQCPGQEDEFLGRLAELCGKIPLAMCIAGSRVDDFENPDELLQLLQEQPMKTLQCPEKDQYVYRAINMSYKKSTDEEQETLLRLAVFEGDFSKDAARVVIEKENLDTTDILKKLVRRSLIQQPIKHRYSIHLLNKHFLKHQQKSENETAERARARMMRAEVLMVKYYLKLGHDLTIQSYSKDGYKDNREALKKDAHNIHNVLKICCQQGDSTTSKILDCLANSEIYTTSARHFSLFVRTIIPATGTIVDEFLQQCANLAEEKKQLDIKLNFDCLLADQERMKAVATGKSDEYLKKREAIEKEFQMHYEDLNFKENKSLCAHYHYLHGRYLTFKFRSPGENKERKDLQIQARKQLEKSFELRKTLTGTSVGIAAADKVFSLLKLGNLCKVISRTTPDAEKYFREAIQLSENYLGEHELTSTCYKCLGDLFLTNKKYELAEEWYILDKEMKESLGLKGNERHVRLLNNLGICLTESNRANEAIEVLESARDMVEKMVESDEVKRSKAKVYTLLAFAYDSVQNNSEAVTYAHKALGFQKDIKINTMDLNKLHKIVSNNVGNN